MRPTFEDVSRLRVSRVARPRFGEIVVFASGGLLVAHRVVGGNARSGYRTKGDGLAYLDRGRVPAGEILGVVAAFERNGLAYGTEGRGARIYALLAGSLSSIEGCLFRFAWRLDAALTRLSGPLARGRHGGGIAASTGAGVERSIPAGAAGRAPLPDGPDAPAGPVPSRAGGSGLAGISLLRRSLRAAGRAAFAVCDACLFRPLHVPLPDPFDPPHSR